MTKNQRAEYFVKMRMLWMSANKVLALDPVVTNKEYSGALLNLLSINQAFAEARRGRATPSAAVQVAGTTVRTKQGQVVSIPYDAKSCVVAGYIGAYGKVSNIHGDNRDGCSIDLAVATYKSNPDLEFVQKANEECAAEKSTQIACNPIIYGYPGGKAACIDRRSQEYQQATHYNSSSGAQTCDGKSRLTSSDEVIKFNEKDYSNMQPREKQIAAIEEDQKKNDYALTKAYIEGVINKKDPVLLALLEKGEWNLALDEELVKIQTQFEQEIERAIKSCEADISSKHEKNQKQACDQLHRRWLFTERFIAKLRDKSCIKPAVYIGAYADGEASYSDTAKDKAALNKKTIDAKGSALCGCPDSDKKINFGDNCAAPQATAVSADATPASVDSTPASQDDTEAFREEKKEEKKTNWLPWVLGGLGVLALVALFNKNKKKDQPPPPPVCDRVCAMGSVLNPTSCSCDVQLPPPVCLPPKTGTPPNCSCPAAPGFCTPPQKIYDLNTCQCNDVPQAPTCADGSLAPGGITVNCPKCPDGSYRTTAGCPTEGGNGNNCPQGGCSGGLPGGTGN